MIFRRSIPITMIILFSIGSIVYNFVDYLKTANEMQNISIMQEADRLVKQFERLKPQLATLSAELAQQRLEWLQTNQDISFFLIRSGRGPASSSMPEFVDSTLNPILDGNANMFTNKDTNEPIAVYIGEAINGVEFTIGKFLTKDYYRKNMAASRAEFWRTNFALILMVALLIFHVLKDYRLIYRRIQWGGLAGFHDGLGVLSYGETEAMATAINHGHKARTQAKGELALMRKQILPSLLREIDDGRPLPYNIRSVLVRVDINNSTPVFENPRYSEIQSHWFIYFKLIAGELASKYGGLAHEAKGDEVISRFNAEVNNDADTLAMSYIRDLFDECKYINEQIALKYDWEFTVKASMARGSLRVFEEVLGDSNGQPTIGLEGVRDDASNPFVVTERVKKLITKDLKATNTLVAGKSIADAASSIVRSTMKSDIAIQGIESAGEFVIVTQFHKLNTLTTPKILYHRNDHAIGQIVDTVHEIIANGGLESAACEWIGLLKSITGARKNEGLITKWTKLLSLAFSQSTKGLYLRATATMLSTSPNIIRGSVEGDLEKLLIKFMLQENPRIQANAIDAWCEVGNHSVPLVHRLDLFKHNRSLANALIMLLSKKLEPLPLKRLKRMLTHDNPLMIAAGCYAFGKILEKYQATEPLILQTNTLVIKIGKIVITLEGHKDEMVRRQAQRALAPVGEELKALYAGQNQQAA